MMLLTSQSLKLAQQNFTKDEDEEAACHRDFFSYSNPEPVDFRYRFIHYPHVFKIPFGSFYFHSCFLPLESGLGDLKIKVNYST